MFCLQLCWLFSPVLLHVYRWDHFYYFDENNYLFQKKTWYNLVQILESFSSRRRVDKRFRVVSARTSGSWDNVQSGLAIVLATATTTFKMPWNATRFTRAY